MSKTEWFMTYGWVIVITLLIGAGLYALGTINPANYGTETKEQAKNVCTVYCQRQDLNYESFSWLSFDWRAIRCYCSITTDCVVSNNVKYCGQVETVSFDLEQVEYNWEGT